ncbi:MAG: hypothetical protein JXR88_06775 [Clostridia bacterium]|nr:hypothetical protein [Clostridia bacterium]
MKSIVDLKNIPFSRYGSYFVLSEINEKLFIRDVRRGDLDPGNVFEIIKPDHFDYEVLGDETELILRFESGDVHLIMPDEKTLRIRTDLTGITLVMAPNKYDNYFLNPKGYYEICSYASELRFGLHPCLGAFDIASRERQITISLKDASDLVIESYKVASSYVPQSYTEGLNQVKESFKGWLKNTTVSDDDKSRLAAYITWSNMVHPEGQLKREAMYMSMNWMTNIWSWDNCFGAILLSKSNPQLAFDQYIFFKDLQDDTGMLPDYANTIYASYASAKPPIYGWAYRYMIRRNPIFLEHRYLEEVYDFVEKFTEFWLNHRTINGKPYYTHGNESGWDNGTNFEEGVPVMTPDLLAFLIDQIDFLTEIGAKLSRELSKWEVLLEQFMEQLMSLWDGNQFRAYLIEEKRFVKTGDTLQNYLPILILNRLDVSVREKLVEGLLEEGRFLTEYGLATESLKSEQYRYNGYWKGPIWAPTMLMFIDGLRNFGALEYAKTLSDRFIKCMKIGGMAENFDPLTGEGLVDPSFAWTSSVYLTLLDELGTYET